MTLLRKKFDYTAFATVLAAAAGYEYHIVGLEVDNNTGSSFGHIVRYEFVYVSGNVNIFGEYNVGAFLCSMGAKRSWKITPNVVWAVIPEGKHLLYDPNLNIKRVSGVLYYYKVSTAEEETTPLRTLMGIGI